MRIRVLQEIQVAIAFRPGDEIIVQHIPLQLEQLLVTRRLDGACLVEIVEDESETATVAAVGETRGRGRGQRSSTLP